MQLSGALGTRLVRDRSSQLLAYSRLEENWFLESIHYLVILDEALGVIVFGTFLKAYHTALHFPERGIATRAGRTLFNMRRNRFCSWQAGP